MPSICGQLNTENVSYVLETLNSAADKCLLKEFDALVTGPIHKGIINESGLPFSGHTEYLASRSGACTPVMLLATGSLRVALVTTHIPLSFVARALSQEKIEKCIRLLHSEFKNKFKITNPRILVCGLNPHAGENGHLGTEEAEIIAPAIKSMQEEGIDVSGPFPADTIFTKKYIDKADVILAMYHDQGLPVIKYAGFGQAVNITLGLPFIRTSVDHGTALDLAGTGKADPSSLIAAINTAIELAS